MENIIEYIDVEYDKTEYLSKFELLSNFTSTSYKECGAKSWVLTTSENYEIELQNILDKHKKVHTKMCRFGTGFNYSPTDKHTVPPHIDIEQPKYFNLLLPIYGTAKIEIFKTDNSQLEYRHGQKHWKMLQEQIKSEKLGEILVDKPVLLDTNYLHNVRPIKTPRLVWCSRWIEIDATHTFKTFKSHIESVLNG